MSERDESWSNGPVGIFPLPNAVLFPGTTLPLQIYEPRYRSMIRDALADQEIIALALLQPGYEAMYYTNYADIYSIVGVGHIREHVQVVDGRYFINLHGICRAQVVEEYQEGKYRVALLEPIPENHSGIDRDGEFAARHSFKQILGDTTFDAIDDIHIYRELTETRIPLGEIVDKVASGLLPLESVEIKQELLEEFNTLKRARILLNELSTLSRALEFQLQSQNEWPHLGSMN